MSLPETVCLHVKLRRTAFVSLDHTDANVNRGANCLDYRPFTSGFSVVLSRHKKTDTLWAAEIFLVNNGRASARLQAINPSDSDVRYFLRYLEMTKRLVNSVLSLNVSMNSQSLFVSVNQVMSFGIYAPGNILSPDRWLTGWSHSPYTVTQNFINLSNQSRGCVCMEHQEMKLEMFWSTTQDHIWWFWPVYYF